MRTMEKLREIRIPQVGDSYRGIKIEEERQRNFAFYTSVPLIELYAHKQHLELINADDVPKEGPLLIVSNHPTWLSAPLLPWAVGRATGRMPSTVLKRGLVEPFHREDLGVGIRTGKSRGVLAHPAVNKAVRGALLPAKMAMASYIRNGIDAIPIDRDKPRGQTFKDVKGKLQEGKPVSIFLQETKTPVHSLKNSKPAAALIIRENPGINVVLVAQNLISAKERQETGEHSRIVFSRPFRSGTPEFNPNGNMRVKEIQVELLNGMEVLLYEAGVKHVLRPDPSAS